MGKSKPPMLPCPRCKAPALAGSRERRGWTWQAGDLAECPSCKALLAVHVTDDYEDDRVASLRTKAEPIPAYCAPPRLVTRVEQIDEHAFIATVKADGSEWTSAARTSDEACARALTSALAVQLQLREKEAPRG